MDPKSCIGATVTDTMDILMKPAKEETFMDEKALKMMEKMGYKKGCGLGKSNQGRLDPVVSSMQQGRQGLGSAISEQTNLVWDFNKEEIKIKEDVQWISSITEPFPALDVLKTWIVIGEKKLHMNDEFTFCDSVLLRNVLEAKELLDLFEPLELCKARSRANPFETLKCVFFLNRAAVKMANIDAASGFLFTNVEKTLPPNCLNKPCYFADVCAGPGGFSEYILWRKQWRYKGFGFTLRGENDFKLSDFLAAPIETFQPLYGAQNDGNIYDPSNITDFTEKVLEQTENLGVHFMMADGGFSVEGNENLQEVLSKQIYLCQCLVALAIVREGGHFVTKLFDLFTPFSVSLVYLMYRCFESVTILKPNASRPANSERYLICKRKRKNTKVVVEFLMHINNKLWTSSLDANMDVSTIVPSELIRNDTNFFTYIVNSNNSLCQRQIINLMKIIAFSKNQKLVEARQINLRTECLRYWNLPDKVRPAPQKLSPHELLATLLDNTDWFYSQASNVVTEEDLKKYFSKIRNWQFCILNENKSRPLYKFYIACGGSLVYKLKNNVWTLSTMHIGLPRGSLLIAEEVMEQETNSQKKTKSILSFHIIDACFLGNVNLLNMTYSERSELIQCYCAALNNPNRADMVRIRAKPVFHVKDVCKMDAPLKISVKNGNEKYASYIPNTNGTTYFFFGYILIFDGARIIDSYSSRIHGHLIEYQHDAADNEITWQTLQNYFKQ